MLDILDDIMAGKGRSGDMQLLKELAESVKSNSLCGLGQTAPNPVLTCIRYFDAEIEDHIEKGICLALACKPLIQFSILADKCQGCGICRRECPADAIIGDKKMVHTIDQAKCIKCGTCLEKCPERFSAIVKTTGRQINTPADVVHVG